jgi:hypothetical protein
MAWCFFDCFMTRSGELTFAASKSFSFNAFHLHHDAVLNDYRNFAELQPNQSPANMFDGCFELPWITRIRKWKTG